jgi:hypothetical protein
LPYYAVHRTKNFKKIWRQTADLNLNPHMGEYFPCALSMCLGKMKKLPVFFISREQNYVVKHDPTETMDSFAPDQIKPAVENLSFEIEPDDEIARQEVYSLVLEKINSAQQRSYQKMLRPKPLITQGTMALKNSRWLRVIYKELMTGGIDSSISPKEISDFQKLKVVIPSKPLGKDEHIAARIS